MSLSDQAKGLIYMLIATLCFGSYGVWSRFMSPDFDLFYQGWTRAVVILLIIMPVIFIQRSYQKIDPKDYKYFFWFCLTSSLTQAPIYYAFNNMPVSSAHLLFFSSMLISMYAYGILVFKEKMDIRKIIGFLFALTGLVIIFDLNLKQATLLAILAAIMNGVFSGSEVSISKKISSKYSPLFLSAIGWAAVIVANLPISFLLKENFYYDFFSIEWLYQIIYSLVSVLGFWSVIVALKYLEASIGGLLLLSEIIFAVLFGIFIFHDQITSSMLYGLIFILLAGAIPYLKSICLELVRKGSSK